MSHPPQPGSIQLSDLDWLLETQPKPVGWTMFVSGSMMRVFAKHFDDDRIFQAAMEGSIGVAPPPTAIVVWETDGTAWCWWRAEAEK